jgi:RHS repeat-associated protein
MKGVDGKACVTTSHFDSASRRVGLTYPNGKYVAQSFTARHQLASVQYDGLPVATMGYDPGMRLSTKAFANGKTKTRSYRADNRLTRIETPGVTDFQYTYDANKNPLTKQFATNPADSQTYSYDSEDRLTNFQRNDGFYQNWNLSLVGDWNQFNNNGSNQVRTHNAVHELTKINSTTLSYDPKGNLTNISNGQTYQWDFENLLKQAQVGNNTTQYKYDAFRRRVKKTTASSSTVFVYDGWRSIAEYENGALPTSPARVFVFGMYLDEPLMQISASGAKHYYHTDHLYSVYALTDASGVVVERYRYNAYGQTTVTNAAFIPNPDPNNSAFGNPFTFTGQRLDRETGLMYYKNRYYETALGRFVSRDPINFLNMIIAKLEINKPSQSEHSYDYKKNIISTERMRVIYTLYEWSYGMPTNEVDPLGLIPGIHRNWCGPGHGGAVRGIPPAVDCVDNGCMEHDLCYVERKYFDTICDLMLCCMLKRCLVGGKCGGWLLGLQKDIIETAFRCPLLIAAAGGCARVPSGAPSLLDLRWVNWR